MDLSWLFDRPFAHRGLHQAAEGRIENSPAAFAAAISHGLGIELDVQLTADGAAVVFHDDDLTRLAGRPELVTDLSLAALEAVPLTGSEDHIPGLARVLRAIHGRAALLIEIKSKPQDTGPLERAVADLLADYHGPVAVMSFNPLAVSWYRDNRPHIVCGLVASTRYRKELGWRLSNSAGQRRTVEETAPDFVAYDIRSLPNGFTRACRASDIPLLTWTVRTPADHMKAAMHADNIIFEEP